MLRLQIVRDRLGREGIADIVKRIPHDPFQLIELAHLIPPYNVRKNRGIVDVSNGRVDFILPVGAQMRGRKAAQTNVAGKLNMDVANLRISAFKRQILPEGERINAESDIPSCQIGGNLRGHHAGVGTRHIKIHIKVRCQRIDDLFPAVNFLNLVQKKIGFPIRIKPALQFLIHLFCRHILVFHGVKTIADDLFLENAALVTQLLHDHFQNRGFAAAPNASEDFYKRRVHIRHYLVHI